MDRVEKRRQGEPRSPYANKSEVGTMDRPLLDTPMGREADNPNEDGFNETESVERQELYEKTFGNRPRGDVTNFHDPGSDAEETSDGLTASVEAVRHAAEDVPPGPNEDKIPESIPVFDRRSQGEIILRTRTRRLIFIAGLIGFVILALLVRFMLP